MPKLLGYTLDTSDAKMAERESSSNGYLPSDWRALKDLGLFLKDGSTPNPAVFGKDADTAVSIKQFFRWIAGKERHPMPPLVRRILCSKRVQLKEAMDSMKTTNAMRTREHQLVAEIDRMLVDDGVGVGDLEGEKCPVSVLKAGAWSKPWVGGVPAADPAAGTGLGSTTPSSVGVPTSPGSSPGSSPVLSPGSSPVSSPVSSSVVQSVPTEITQKLNELERKITEATGNVAAVSEKIDNKIGEVNDKVDTKIGEVKGDIGALSGKTDAILKKVEECCQTLKPAVEIPDNGSVPPNTPVSSQGSITASTVLSTDDSNEVSKYKEEKAALIQAIADNYKKNNIEIPTTLTEELKKINELNTVDDITKYENAFNKKKTIENFNKNLEDAINQQERKKAVDALSADLVKNITIDENTVNQLVHKIKQQVAHAGLENCGNTCYLNAVLQMLSNIPEFVQNLTKNDRQKVLFSIIKDLYNDTNTLVNLTNKTPLFQEIFQDLKNTDTNHAQQEASEFIMRLFDKFNIDTKYFDINKEVDVKCTHESIYDRKPSVENKHSVLELPLNYTDPANPANSKESIEIMLDRIQRSDNVTDVGCCTNENTDVNTTKQYYANATPEEKSEICNNVIGPGKKTEKLLPTNDTKYLIMYIKRFIWKSKTEMNKREDPVTLDQQITIDNVKFNLDGCILHGGSLKGGHYTYLKINDNKGILYNDRDVTEYDNYVSVPDLETKCYIVLYKREEAYINNTVKPVIAIESQFRYNESESDNPIILKEGSEYLIYNDYIIKNANSLVKKHDLENVKTERSSGKINTYNDIGIRLMNKFSTYFFNKDDLKIYSEYFDKNKYKHDDESLDNEIIKIKINIRNLIKSQEIPIYANKKIDGYRSVSVDESIKEFLKPINLLLDAFKKGNTTTNYSDIFKNIKFGEFILYLFFKSNKDDITKYMSKYEKYYNKTIYEIAEDFKNNSLINHIQVSDSNKSTSPSILRTENAFPLNNKNVPTSTPEQQGPAIDEYQRPFSRATQQKYSTIDESIKELLKKLNNITIKIKINESIIDEDIPKECVKLLEATANAVKIQDMKQRHDKLNELIIATDKLNEKYNKRIQEYRDGLLKSIIEPYTIKAGIEATSTAVRKLNDNLNSTSILTTLDVLSNYKAITEYYDKVLNDYNTSIENIEEYNKHVIDEKNKKETDDYDGIEDQIKTLEGDLDNLSKNMLEYILKKRAEAASIKKDAIQSIGINWSKNNTYFIDLDNFYNENKTTLDDRRKFKENGFTKQKSLKEVYESYFGNIDFDIDIDNPNIMIVKAIQVLLENFFNNRSNDPNKEKLVLGEFFIYFVDKQYREDLDDINDSEINVGKLAAEQKEKESKKESIISGTSISYNSVIKEIQTGYRTFMESIKDILNIKISAIPDILDPIQKQSSAIKLAPVQNLNRKLGAPPLRPAPASNGSDTGKPVQSGMIPGRRGSVVNQPQVQDMGTIYRSIVTPGTAHRRNIPLSKLQGNTNPQQGPQGRRGSVSTGVSSDAKKLSGTVISLSGTSKTGSKISNKGQRPPFKYRVGGTRRKPRTSPRSRRTPRNRM